MNAMKVAAVLVTAGLLFSGCKDDKGGNSAATTATGASPTATKIAEGATAGAGSAAAGADAGTASAASAPGAADPKKEAQEVFASRCAACHGPQGAGDGAASAALNPKPRNFKDPAWQKSVTDDHIEKIIAQGGAAVGKSPLMPANPDLVGKPVIPALREHVRSLGGQK